MSDIVNEDDLSELAAEYVLGTLDPDERGRANVLLDVDHGFRGLVRVWERRFGELHLMVEPVEPDPKIWEHIKDRLGPFLPPPSTPSPAVLPEPPPASKPASVVDEQQLAELIHEVEKLAEAVNADAAMVKAETEVAGEPAGLNLAVPLAKRDETPKPMEEVTPARPSPVTRWQAVALTMTVLAIVLSGLIAAWRFIPDQLPLGLRPKIVFSIPEPPPPPERLPAQHGTQFEE
jgi:hypothetical protein